MSSRVMFEQMKFFKKELTERFLLVTQAVYRSHPEYTYRDEEEDSEILIYPSYADTDSDGKQPRMVVKVGSYDMSLMDTFNNNMSKEVFRDGKLSGYKHQQIVPAQLTVLVQAYAEEESSDLADELSGLILFAAKGAYAKQGFVTRRVQVSETDLADRSQKLYQTAVSISFDVPWTWVFESKEPGHDGIEIDIIDDPLIVDGYRSPGVYTVQMKDKEVF